MKNIELRKVPCGETFTVFGEEYVVLDHVDGGVRPVLNFSSCLLVSWQDEEPLDIPDEIVMKEKRWDAYIAYLNDWADDHSAAECYGAAPMGFDEWLEEEYEEDEDDAE